MARMGNPAQGRKPGYKHDTPTVHFRPLTAQLCNVN